jgi:hypothetical protein
MPSPIKATRGVLTHARPQYRDGIQYDGSHFSSELVQRRRIFFSAAGRKHQAFFLTQGKRSSYFAIPT